MAHMAVQVSYDLQEMFCNGRCSYGMKQIS